MHWKKSADGDVLYLGEHQVASVFKHLFSTESTHAVSFFLPTLYDMGCKYSEDFETKEEAKEQAERLVKNWLHNALLREIK